MECEVYIWNDRWSLKTRYNINADEVLMLSIYDVCDVINGQIVEGCIIKPRGIDNMIKRMLERTEKKLTNI